MRALPAQALAFPPELPVSQRAEEIAAAIAAHRVVIVCGETGSGKTTQLPKICLAAGRGSSGQIAHTQPRRIAARTVAERIAAELGEDVGQSVGYRVRFTDRTSPDGFITLMTDGVLLADTVRDPLLRRYDTIIIDEAHERSLNIDFLLGYLHRLLARRDDLKVIITSATLDAQRFAAHFAPVAGEVPVIEVSGRLYPVEIRYRPIASLEETDDEKTLYDGIIAALEELWHEAPGDALVFLPGEREIREAAAAIEEARPAGKREVEILPLFARQSAAEQARVFARSARMRVILATNVAETSLTVPNIRYVIDSGLARIKRYSPRSRIELLKIEPISQAAANQRAGRCGRVMNGVCVRLYSEEDFARRPAHTDPEILRTSLASVLLRMADLKLGAIESFPFLDPPPRRAVADAVKELMELGALEPQTQRLTDVGKVLARLPLDPHLGRLLIAGKDYGCLREMRVLAAALSVQDPRERPMEQEAQAEQQHAKFRGNEREAKSEFCWYLNLWAAWSDVRRHQSRNKQRQWARAHFLSWRRLEEWHDVAAQLHQLTGEHGWRDNDVPAGYETLHTALITSLARGIGVKDPDPKPDKRGSYLGAGGTRFWLHPSTGPIRRTSPQWVLAAERVETTKLYARTVAVIDPRWIEAAVPHLIERQVSEPHWDARAGEVRGRERGVLFGLTVYVGRPVSYRRIDPALCRELMIRDGLVAGDVAPQVLAKMPFLRHNLKLVEELRALEERLRRSDLVDERLIEAFYEERIPKEVGDIASLNAWRREAERENPKLLYLSRERLLAHEVAGTASERFPLSFPLFGQTLPLKYVHDPAAHDDGVTLEVPLALLNQVPVARTTWLVPGMLPEKVSGLLKSLPQKLRHRLQPLAASVEAFLEQARQRPEWGDQRLEAVLASWVRERTQLPCSPEQFRPETLPAHCFMNFRVLDAHGRVLAEGRNLAALKAQYAQKAGGAFAALASAWAQRQGAAVATAAAGAVSSAAGCRQESGSVGASLAREDQRVVLPETAARSRDGSMPLRRTRDDAAATAAAAMAPQQNSHYTPNTLDVAASAAAWAWEEIPEIAEVTVAGVATIGFPALEDTGEAVRLRLFDTEEAAVAAHARGVWRLLALALKEHVRQLARDAAFQSLALSWPGKETPEALRQALVTATLARIVPPPAPRTRAAYEVALTAAKEKFTLIAREMIRAANDWVAACQRLERALERLARDHPETVADIRAQLAALLPPGFLASVPWTRLQHYGRYLKAIEVRLEKLAKDPARDRRWLEEWRRAALPWQKVRAQQRGPAPPFWEEYRWWLEELRVALFASELKTPMPVSVKRLEKLWAQQGGG